MDHTANLALPYILPAQAQKHVTHNAALQQLDALMQLAVADRDLTAPPEAPADGDRYLVAADAGGAWAGWDGCIAARAEGAWLKLVPAPGWLCWVADEAVLLAFTDGGWGPAQGGPPSLLQNLSHLGLAATADDSNPFIATLNSALWNGKATTWGGTGDLRIAHNKEAEGDSAVLLFETGYSARAEIGLVGNDDFSVRVSPDGGTWRDALVARKDDGRVRFPHGLLHAGSWQPMHGLVLFPATMDGVTTAWHSDTPRTGNPRTAAVAAVSGDTITLASAVARGFGRYAGYMSNGAYLRIWNQSTSPEQSAWVVDTPADDQLTVLDAAAVAGWSPGDTIRLGEPSGIAPVGSFAIDISPMLQMQFGSTFRQQAVLLRLSVTGDGDAASLAVSDTAADFSILMPVTSAPDGATRAAQVTMRCSVQSPISDTNLIFVREEGPLASAGINVLGVYG